MIDTKEKKQKKKTDEKDKPTRLEDYLAGGRKKSRNYVVFAFGNQFDPDLAKAMVENTKNLYPQLSVLRSRNIEELGRHLARMLSLVVIDDEFAEMDVVVKLLKVVKDNNKKDAIPTLFMTKNPKKLIEIYQKDLNLYQETDEYIEYPEQSFASIMSRLKNGVDQKNKRRSRRYRVREDIRFFVLAKDRWFEGQLIDLSLHGAIVASKEAMTFLFHDQLKIVIEKFPGMDTSDGEFIKISARVQRVMISGDQAAVSFEYVSDHQHKLLVTYLNRIVSRQMSRQAKYVKAQLARRGGFD